MTRGRGRPRSKPELVEISIPVSASPTVRAAVRFLATVGEMLIKKNQDYGDSAAKPLRIFSRAERDELVRVRIDDKLSRLLRGKAAGEDIVLDLCGYLALLRAIEMEGQA